MNTNTENVSAPRVLVVDGARLVRQLIRRVLASELPQAEVVDCDSGAAAQTALRAGRFDFVTVALMLPDMDGLELVRFVREDLKLRQLPVVVVSGEASEHLQGRALSRYVTDYFDKSQGLLALAEFIRCHVQPERQAAGTVLYVEDSRVVALATRRMMEKHGLTVHHVTSAEAALESLPAARETGVPEVDVVLTDVNLSGQLTGGDLVAELRNRYRLSREVLPILVMTGDENPVSQAALLALGANDLVVKPVEERKLLARLLSQVRLAQQERGARSRSDP